MLDTAFLAFQQGGLWMWLILFFQVISLYIIFERIIFLYFRRQLTQKAYAETCSSDIRKGRIETIIAKAERDFAKYPLARALYQAAQTAAECGGRDEIQGKMDEVLLAEVSVLDKRTQFLVMLGNVGTLTGLLGTIVGMIKAFSAVTYANPSEKASLLSSGISEAMNTTAYGLIMAIPALFMFAVLQSRSNSLQEDLAQGALKIFNLLTYNYQTVWEKKISTDKKEVLLESLPKRL